MLTEKGRGKSKRERKVNLCSPTLDQLPRTIEDHRSGPPDASVQLEEWVCTENSYFIKELYICCSKEDRNLKEL